MALATFLQMKQRIAGALNKSLTTYESDIEEALLCAIREEENSRYWFLETLNSSSLTLASGQRAVSLSGISAPLKKITSLRYRIDTTWYGAADGFTEVTFDQLQQLYTSTVTTGAPSAWALYNFSVVTGSAIYFDKVADQSYPLEIAYIRGDATYPVNDSDTSIWFQDDAKDLIHYRAMENVTRDRFHAFDWSDRFKIKADQIKANLISRHNTRNYRHRLA